MPRVAARCMHEVGGQMAGPPFARYHPYATRAGSTSSWASPIASCRRPRADVRSPGRVIGRLVAAGSRGGRDRPQRSVRRRCPRRMTASPPRSPPRPRRRRAVGGYVTDPGASRSHRLETEVVWPLEASCTCLPAGSGREPLPAGPRRLLDVPRRPDRPGHRPPGDPAHPPRAGPDPARAVAVRSGSLEPASGSRSARSASWPRRPASGQRTSRRSTTSTWSTSSTSRRSTGS